MTPPALETDATVVVGAGVVGLAVARAILRRGAPAMVIEGARAVGTGVTARSSEVIHAGLYYPPGSLEAETCLRGRELLYGFAEARGVPYRQVGKLVVATAPEQLGALEGLAVNARASGATEVERWTPRQVARLEPEVRCAGALWSPRSGIVDSHALARALAAEVEAGGDLVLGAPVTAIAPAAGGLELTVSGASPTRLRSPRAVVAAGLGTWDLAASALPAERRPARPTRFAKGSYFALSGSPSPFRRLVYPLPEPGGLGIHATVDLGGRVRFGPDVEWVDRPDDLRVDPARRPLFEAAIRRYWPGLPDGALQPAYAGIRPRRTGPGEPRGGFLRLGPDRHGVEGLTVLLGIESPGLTAALALAEVVAHQVLGR